MSIVRPMRCSRTRGKKGEPHHDPQDPPRRRANKKKGHGTYDNDRPPVVGTVGRASGQCRLQVCRHTDGATLRAQVQRHTTAGATCYSDEWKGYSRLERTHWQVEHGKKQWAWDADGDGINEVHTNSIEGLWTSVRNWLRPFRGVHKRYLQGYVVMCQHAINYKRISPHFIAQLVQHLS